VEISHRRESLLVGCGRLPAAALPGDISLVCEEPAVVPAWTHGTLRPTCGVGASLTPTVAPNNQIGTPAGNLPPPVGDRGSGPIVGALPRCRPRFSTSRRPKADHLRVLCRR
jgi:hypothetical protein